jgi:hypothetical protein
MVEHYIKIVEEHLWKVIASNQRNWYVRSHFFLLGYREPMQNTRGLTPERLVFRRALQLCSDLMFEAPSNDQQSIMRQIWWTICKNINNYSSQHLQLVSNHMKIWYDKLANCAGYQEGKRVWIYRPIHTKGKLLILHSPLEGLYKIITQINDVVHRIQRNPRSKIMVVHLEWLTPYQGAVRD